MVPLTPCVSFNVSLVELTMASTPRRHISPFHIRMMLFKDGLYGNLDEGCDEVGEGGEEEGVIGSGSGSVRGLDGSDDDDDDERR